MVQVRLQLILDLGGTDTNLDLDTRLSQGGEATAGHVGIRIDDAHDDTAYTGVDHCGSARSGATVVAAGFKGRVERRPPRLLTRLGQRDHLGMGAARWEGRPGADDPPPATTTAPTQGLGEVRYRAPAAASMA